MKKQIYFPYETLLIPLILIFIFTTAFSPVPDSALSIHADDPEFISKGIAYLATQINDDGGIRWFDETSSVAATIKVIQALAAMGYEQDFLQSKTGNSPIDYLEMAGPGWINQEETDTPSFSVARAGQLLTAVAAANLNPQRFGPEAVDLVYPIVASYDPNTGIYGAATPENVSDQVWAMMGLAANAFSIPPEAAIWLKAAQLGDGSWNDGFGSFLDTTPLAIMALIASGETSPDSPEVVSAIYFLTSYQQHNGGWQSQWDTTTNANTTAMILQAISALGQLPMEKTWQNHEGNPYSALLAIQQENGAIGGDFANAYSTADAIVALSGQTLFSLGYLYKASQSFEYLISQQGSDGGWGNTGQTLDIILAFQAAGWDPNTITVSGITPLDYVAENLSEYIEIGPDAIGKAILGVTAAGFDPASFAGVDLVSILNATYDDSTSAFGSPENSWHQAMAMLGLKASGQSIPLDVIETLKGLQKDDGGWEYASGSGTWPDNTALAIQALLAAGESPESVAIKNGLDYLQNMRAKTGGWGDSSTTAFGMLALNALGIENRDWENDGGKTPLSELLSYQKSNGAFVYNWEYPDNNLMSTASALLALFGRDWIVSHSSVAQSYAGLVIDPGESKATLVCVDLDDNSMNGLDLLDAAGISYSAPQGYVESIMDISNPDGETNYWSYWSWDGNAWIFSATGAGDSSVLPGSIEAWHFTSWEVFPSLPPDGVPVLSEICSAPILKDFNTQPNLSYSNLYPGKLVKQEITEPIQTETSVQATGQPSTVTLPPDTVEPLPKPDQEPGPSNLPIFIIAGVGLVVVCLIVFILVKKRK